LLCRRFLFYFVEVSLGWPAGPTHLQQPHWPQAGPLASSSLFHFLYYKTITYLNIINLFNNVFNLDRCLWAITSQPPHSTHKPNPSPSCLVTYAMPTCPTHHLAPHRSRHVDSSSPMWLLPTIHTHLLLLFTFPSQYPNILLCLFIISL